MSCGKKPFTGFILTRIEEDGNKVQIRVPNLDISHQELAVIFTDFLRGSGFVFDHLATYELVEEHSADSMESIGCGDPDCKGSQCNG